MDICLLVTTTALVALSPENGAILSLVGGFDFNQSHFNRAIQAERQPGSNLKPFIYTAALEQGLTPATIINDAPIVFDDSQLESTWRPENASGKFYGPTRLRKALYLSRNLVSIRVLQSIGVGTAINRLEKFGFDGEELPRDLSLALGSHVMTPLEVAAGYAIFANGGYLVEPYVVQRIVDFEDNVLYEASPATVCRDCELHEDEIPEQVIVGKEREITATKAQSGALYEPYDFVEDPFQLSFAIKSLLGRLQPNDYPQAGKVLNDQVAYLIDSMLRDVIRRGTGVKAKTLGRGDLAGKTGTTNGPTDAWFSGYNGEVVATTWLGFDQNLPLGRGEYGGSAALPIWIEYMATALMDRPETQRVQPPGIVTVRIDPETGERARIDDPDAIFEYFRSENVPPLISETPQDPYNDEEVLTEELF